MDSPETKQVEPKTKKPYSKPAVIYKQPLEAMAAVCTPIGPGQGKASSGAPGFCSNLFS